MRSGIVGEKDNLVTMHDILDAQWVYDNTKVHQCSTPQGTAPLLTMHNLRLEQPCAVSWPSIGLKVHRQQQHLCLSLSSAWRWEAKQHP